MKIDEAKDVLQQLQLPKAQQSDMCARVLLALARMREADSWKKVSNEYSRPHDIRGFLASEYNVVYAENTRETIRKAALKPFRSAAIVEDNGKPTNSPNFAYRLTTETIELLRTYGTQFWKSELETFLSAHKSLEEIYAQKRNVKQIPIMINGKPAALSLGLHNKLQKAIVEQFASRFAHNATILYVGDTQNRFLYCNKEVLESLGIEVLENATLPDVILYCEDKQWIYFVEAVTSVGPMSPERVREIERFCGNCRCGKIYVTAFMHLTTYRQFIADIAWDTEVWIAEIPDHMIHLNGDRFLGPR